MLLRSSRSEDDLKPLSSGQACLNIHTEYEGGSIYDYVLKTILVDNSSFRAVHDLALHTESTRMAQALAIIEKLGTPSKSIFESRTDSILFASGRYENKIKEALESTTVAYLPRLYDTLVRAEQNRLDDYCKVDGGVGWQCFQALRSD